jgi:DNA-binding transcriptional ArsR family regulator
MTSDESGFDAKQARLSKSSGWLELTRYQTVRLLIDALLESSPGHKFNKSELERRTGMSRESIRKHIPRLIELGVIEEVDDGGWPEYQLNDDGKVTKELFELNSAANSVLSGGQKDVEVESEGETEVPDSAQRVVTIGRDTLSEFGPEPENMPDNSDDRQPDNDLVAEPPQRAGS